jgi:hypothetical protein
MSVTIVSPTEGTVLTKPLPYSMPVTVSYNENAAAGASASAGGIWTVSCQLIYPSGSGIIQSQQNRNVVAVSGQVVFNFNITTAGTYELHAALNYYPTGGGQQNHGTNDQPNITINAQ